ncbi:GNAT family N-acetyltransferase [Bacteroides sp. OttesenSCG-928-J23]|nr:GNAT family N-acetyltransferase [Bacteroides sp. OttesenSCG-928-N06]MDL2247185.1 GNAT family N-acetyltransferase [Bacteroides sp. OttesenSCG-928-J23]MDL2306075.1 GNAT family N-acetyltransferase [Bacteroides sp. OttesenSCG-928-D19]
MDIQIEKLQKEEYDKVATMLTDAFESNPAYALIFANKDKLRDGLFWLFKTNLFLINRRMSVTRVVKEKGSGKIIGVFSLLPSGGVKPELNDYLQIGLLQFILKFGFRTLYKMLGMDSYNKTLLTKAIGTNEYYYLSMVAIKEEFRGMGIGSFMITHCLEELKSVKRSCHVVGLTTQLPENVTFYARLGFEKLDEGEVKFKQDCYYNYNMKLTIIIPR